MNDYTLERPGLEAHFPQSKQEWKELRRSFVGGSDVAAIAGLVDWATPFTIWCEKMGVSAKKDTLAMKYGRDNEKRILGYAQEILGPEAQIYQSRATYVQGNYGANLDGIAIHDGKEIGIEIKTTSDLTSWDRTPLHYWLQVQHYMNVCGLERFLVIVEGKGWRSHFFEESFDYLGNNIRFMINEFWDFVEKKEPPYMPDFSKKIERDYIVAALRKGILNYKFRESNVMNYLRDYIAAQSYIKKIQEELDILRAKILSAMGPKKELESCGFLAKSKEIESVRFDAARFKEDHPELYELYMKKSSYTQLVVKES